MNIVAIAKMVPDLVEELTVSPDGKNLDYTWLRLKLNEFDDHAIEQAVLLKEQYGGSVTVIGIEGDGLDEALFTAAAKGANRFIKLTGATPQETNNHSLAHELVALVKELNPDLILTGVQAHNDLDGSLGPLLAAYLDYPYIGYIANILQEDGQVVARKEYPGGLLVELRTPLPAVLGIQVASQPPRYVAFSKIRQAMQTALLEERAMSDQLLSESAAIEKMYPPESGAKAKILEGSPETIADELIGVFQDLGII